MESNTAATIWAECQGLLAEACGAMAPGELLHGDNFSLFDAMAAIEIMDPKMDAGMSTKGFKSAQEAIEGGLAPLDLTVPQLLDVMDQLLAYEATWQCGHSLAQTVYSCLYLHAPERTAANTLLNAYCKVARSTCNLIRTMVCVADVHEENEDFIGSTFGFPLELEEDGRCMTLLAAVEETLAKQLKAAQGDPRDKAREDIAPLQADPSLEEPYCSALLARFRFRKAFHQALTHLDKGPTHEKSAQAARQALAAAAKELALIRISTPQLAHRPKSGGPSGASESGGQAGVEAGSEIGVAVGGSGVTVSGDGVTVTGSGVTASGSGVTVSKSGINLSGSGITVGGRMGVDVDSGNLAGRGVKTVAGSREKGERSVATGGRSGNTAERSVNTGERSVNTKSRSGNRGVGSESKADDCAATRDAVDTSARLDAAETLINLNANASGGTGTGGASSAAVTSDRVFGGLEALCIAGQESDGAFSGRTSEEGPVSSGGGERNPHERARNQNDGLANGVLLNDSPEGSVSKRAGLQHRNAESWGKGGKDTATGRTGNDGASRGDSQAGTANSALEEEEVRITAGLRATNITGSDSTTPHAQEKHQVDASGKIAGASTHPSKPEPDTLSGVSVSVPGHTPHNSERMPCTIFLPEGGSTSAPGPTASEAVGIIAGQPPIHTTDVRQGVTGTAEASTASGRLAVGFDESVNRRLLASTPPRSMKILTWTETLDYYDHLLQDLAQITHAPAGRPLSDVIQFVADFSDRQPRIVARSRLFLHLFPEAYLVLGRTLLTELVLDAVHLPQGGMRKDPGVLAFVVKAARAVKQLLRLLCTNGSRQRRRLARSLAEWEEVRKEAEAQSAHNGAVRAWATQMLDAQKALGGVRPSQPWLDHVFTCWTEQQICRIMERHLSLGFPQELYSPSELPVVFWYLARVYVNHAGLLHTEGNHLSAMQGSQLQGGSRRKIKAGESTGRYVPSVDQYLVTAYGRLAWGMTQAFALLQRSQKLPQPASPFNGGFEVYLQRFSPFVSVQQPAALPYDAYTAELDYMLSAQYDVIGGSLRAFEDALEMARVLSTELPNMNLPPVNQTRRAEECRALEQVVQRNIVALKVLAHVGSAATHAVTCDFSYHPFFPVLTVKKVVKKKEGG